jgi:hypothetical protein
VRPEFIIAVKVKCPSVQGGVCNELCQNAILNLKGEDGKPLYALERVFNNITLEDWVRDEDRMLQLY